MNTAQLMYIAAGLILPLYYIPQIRRCLRDDTLLCSYSMGKSGTQLVLRIVMMPFVFGVGDVTMSVIVSMDLVGRTAELLGAMVSLRRQGQTWKQVALRAWPALYRRGIRGSDPAWTNVLTSFGDTPLDQVNAAPAGHAQPTAESGVERSDALS